MLRKLKELVKALEKEEKKVVNVLGGKRLSAFERFPLLFTLLGAFGLVATYYGFERLIDNIEFFNQNPFVLLAVGITTLLVTGSLYDRLS